MAELGPLYQRNNGIEVKFSFAASSVLARQIEAGAGAGVFASADQEWMDYLQQRQLIDVASRRNVAGNQLVLVAPKDSALQLRITPGMALVAALGRGRLATGDPESVPAGRYARMALTAYGVWNEISARLILADNVRTALRFVASGDAPLGIVYSTDAAVEPGVRVVDTFPESSHVPITYPVAVTAGGGDAARRFVAFLGTDVAQAVFRKYGFTGAPRFWRSG
jgi:molybdate transport system substrate-binding protein